MICPYCIATISSVIIQSHQVVLIDVTFNDEGEFEYTELDSSQSEDLTGCCCPLCDRQICETLEEAKILLSPCSIRN